MMVAWWGVPLSLDGHISRPTPAHNHSRLECGVFRSTRLAVLRANHVIVVDCVAGSANETKVGFNLRAHAQGKKPHHSLRTTVWTRPPLRTPPPSFGSV